MPEIRITAENGVINVEGAGSANQLLNLLNIAAASVIAKSSLSTEDPFGTMEEELSVFDRALTETSIREIGRIAEMEQSKIDEFVENYFAVSDSIGQTLEKQSETFDVPEIFLQDSEVSNILKFVEKTKNDIKSRREEL